MTKKMWSAVVVGVLGLALVGATGQAAFAQAQTNSIGPRNIGPPGGGGGGGGGGQVGGCFSALIAGNTYVTVCPWGYNAQAGGIRCSGPVTQAGAGFNLRQGPCNVQGQFFLGGRFSCDGFGGCSWQPSPAARAAGYYPEQVQVTYQ